MPKMNISLGTIIFLMSAISPILAYKILLYPYGHCINSHLLNMEKMAAILLSDGYNVTMLVPSTYNGPYSNSDLHGLHIIHYNPPSKNVKVMCDFESLGTFLNTPLQDLIRAFYESTLQHCDSLLQERHILEQLRAEKFDLAIYDAVDLCSKVLSSYLDILFIAFHTHGLDTVLPRNPAFQPSMLTTYSDDMCFIERLVNTGAYIVQRGISLLTTKFHEDLRIKHNLENDQSLSDSFNRASLKFVLGDFGLDYVGPLHPTTILVGGVIQGKPVKMPDDIKNFLDSAKQGVVLFSFGSLMRTYDEYWQKLFFTALGRLPYKVLWKYQGGVSVDIPDNVYLAKWIPQTQVLKHKSVRAFITHCGWNSAYESAYNGVPVVAIPLFGDQFFQATKITKRAKLGIQLDIRQLTSDKLYKTIMYVTTSEIFRDNSLYISSVMNSRMHSQKSEILYWVDLVIQLNGTNHLISKDIDLAWYQLLLLDVILFTMFSLTLSILCIKLLGMFIFNCTLRIFQGISRLLYQK